MEGGMVVHHCHYQERLNSLGTMKALGNARGWMKVYDLFVVSLSRGMSALEQSVKRRPTE